MNVLVIGGGGREHAICWKLSRDPQVNKVYCIPGNGGIEAIADCPPVDPGDWKALAAFVREKQVGLTVVGPEQPLVDGMADFFEANNLPVFGPNRTAARLEGSKVFAKHLMDKYDIPTAAYADFHDPQSAHAYINGRPEGPLVVKADGLAAGKGSLVCPDRASAANAVDQLMKDRIFAAAGSQVVIEEFMTGEEVSIFVMTDGRDFITLTPAQDFKRALDGDRGKNTGGMGSYAPTPFLTPTLRETVIRTIIEPTLAALKSENVTYKGVLYVGLMLTPHGPKVVEFNCRFGDPETQVVLPMLKSGFPDLLMAVCEERLAEYRLEFHDGAVVDVVLASGGYPDGYEKHKEISGLDSLPEDILAFHAGTYAKDGRIYSNGGRVLAIAARGENLESAVKRAYEGVRMVRFDGLTYRTDIARRALAFPARE